MTERRTDASHIVAKMALRIRELRALRGLSLQELGDRANVAKSHIWEIEQGRSANPTITTAINIANALGVSLDYLTGLSSKQPDLHPEALRIACEIDSLLRRKPAPMTRVTAEKDNTMKEMLLADETVLFLKELSDLSRKYRLGIERGCVYIMEDDDMTYDYALTEESDLVRK